MVSVRLWHLGSQAREILCGLVCRLAIHENPNRQDHHVAPGELQPLLQRKGRMVVQQAGK